MLIISSYTLGPGGWGGGGRAVNFYIGLYGDATPESGTFYHALRYIVYKKVGISQVEVIYKVIRSLKWLICFF